MQGKRGMTKKKIENLNFLHVSILFAQMQYLWKNPLDSPEKSGKQSRSFDVYLFEIVIFSPFVKIPPTDDFFKGSHNAELSVQFIVSKCNMLDQRVGIYSLENNSILR